MTAEFQMEVCQVDVDTEFWDNDWGAPKGSTLVMAEFWCLHPYFGLREYTTPYTSQGLQMLTVLSQRFLLPLPTTMQAYSINNMCPMFSMRDQVTTVLTTALGHIWELIEAVPQPEESLETVYVWVEDWDKTWVTKPSTVASIHSWWRYVNDNGISIPKVCDKCMHDYTKESVMCQNLLVLGAIAIADLWCPVEQRWIYINIFEDYQERVELRAQLEAERLTREPSTCMCRQAAMAIGEGQGCAPSDTGAGESLRGTGGQVRQHTDSTGKGKGKEKAMDKVNELENDEGDHPPNPDPSKAGAPAPYANLPCRECTKGYLGSCASDAGRPSRSAASHITQCKNTGSGETAAGPSHKQTKPTGLLDNPTAPDVSVQDLSKVPPVKETLLVTNLGDMTTHEALAECIQLLENRADDEEFELTQIHQMLGCWLCK
ncbi:hypothetical protein F5J12DRAFT_779769 [Pisolithus orientalis]|uniref:uncharacterized protein n=1 Tax=Pisolithus orientalis TaxID=936130 RepID=UPI00222461F9|nr:uncharacterized protein F5J12DRAFT_779769 [Pisolithus orientalis]KAI6030674.1 hypothetical protein F5J12DRAFT_779769 [Pisolithus orientalis]